MSRRSYEFQLILTGCRDNCSYQPVTDTYLVVSVYCSRELCFPIHRFVPIPSNRCHCLSFAATV